MSIVSPNMLTTSPEMNDFIGMSDLLTDFIIHSGSLESFIIDLSSFSIIILILFFIYFKGIINKKLLIFFSFYSLTPFLFNDVLINSASMWDQYTNILYVNEFRDNIFDFSYYEYHFGERLISTFTKLIVASHFYGIIPIISYSSINSIAFANKLLLVLSAIYLLHKNYLKKSHMFFLLLFPSTIIYFSLSLREALLCIVSLWLIVFFFEKKYFIFLITLCVSFILRPIFFSYLSIFFIYIFLMQNIFNNKKVFYMFNFFLIFTFFYFNNIISEKLNYYINIYNLEEAGWQSIRNTSELNYFSFSPIDILNNLKIVLNKLILNWPAPFKFKIIFIFENLILFYFIIKNFKFDYIKNKFQQIISIIFLFLSIFILYIIFPNLLPMHRYFYPFLFSFIILNKFRYRY